MLNKMGFRGRGLGKDEDGITSPITVEMKSGRGAIGIPNKNNNIPPLINRDLGRLVKENPVKCALDNRVVNKVHPWPSNTTLITVTYWS